MNLELMAGQERETNYLLESFVLYCLITSKEPFVDKLLIESSL